MGFWEDFSVLTHQTGSQSFQSPWNVISYLKYWIWVKTGYFRISVEAYFQEILRWSNYRRGYRYWWNQYCIDKCEN